MTESKTEPRTGTGTDVVTVRVPAKVNVQLAVGAARPDGFHDLANVFLAVGLYDEVSVTPADELRVTCEGPDAAQALQDIEELIQSRFNEE